MAQVNRRAFLSGLLAAPAVIRVAPLMRIAPVPLVTPLQAWSIDYLNFDERDILRISLPSVEWRRVNLMDSLINPPALLFGNGTLRPMEPHEIAPGLFAELPSPPA